MNRASSLQHSPPPPAKEWRVAAEKRPAVAPLPLARLAGPLALAAGALFTLTQLVAAAVVATVDHGETGWREDLLNNPLYVANGVGHVIAFSVLAVALVAVYEWQTH